MGYIINRYNGAILTSVEDGTVNLTTELKLVGKNFAGYGEAQNENFIHLMENFASPTPPGKPLSGMIWYDSTVNKLKFYDGTRFRTSGSAEVSGLQPVGNVEGDLWWNSNTNQLYTRSSAGEWVLVGPQNTVLGTTQFVSDVVNDVNGITFGIIKAVLTEDGAESTVLVIADSDFTIREEDQIDNFSNIIKRGITLADTDESGSSTDTILWGTASNAQKLGGRPLSDFVIKPTEGLEFIIDSPLIIDNILKISENESVAVVENTASDTISFRINSAGQQTVLVINSSGLIPGEDNKYNIGSSDLKWKDIHAVTFRGTGDRANQLGVVADNVANNVVGDPTFLSYQFAKVGAISNSIASRDNSGNLNAILFQGVATTAQYADLAEKYTTEKIWPTGTVMTICDHADHEAGPASADSIAIGVISENPAYLMNSEINGQPIALKGRVPVRIIGPVRKGQAVYAQNHGVCSTIVTLSLVGIALITNLDNEEKLVECVLSV